MPDAVFRQTVRGVRPGAILRELRTGRTRELAAPECAPPECAPTEPTLNLERDGDRVVRITASCACGREILIQCDYEEFVQQQA